MANPDHLAILKQGVEAWNAWRLEHWNESAGDWDVVPDLSGEDMNGIDLVGANLAKARLRRTSLCEANLSRADLREADLVSTILKGTRLSAANLRKANLRHAKLSGAFLDEAQAVRASFRQAECRGAKLRRANLRRAYLRKTDLREADLREARLIRATIMDTDLRGADLSGSNVYGSSVWNVQLEDARGLLPPTKQVGLIITAESEPPVTVDSLEVAQFIYLLLNNEKVKSVLDTVTSKVVLILGRFSEERKPVLDALREELRRHDYVPVIFDFDKPMDKSIAGTVTTLAKLARFVVADVTDASWVTVETQLIVRESRSVPFRLIKHESASVPSPINDLRPEFEPPLIKPFDYKSPKHAVASVKLIVKPAEDMAEAIRRKRKEADDNPW